MAGEPSNSELASLVRITAAIGTGDESRLKQELERAMSAGITLSIIREVILQSYLFAGYARTINAFIVLNGLTQDRSAFAIETSTSSIEWKQRGEKLCRQIYGDKYDKLLHNMQQLHPELADWMIVEGYGKVLSRPLLSARVRELLVVAATAVLGVQRQFHSHVRGALHVGASKEDLRSVFSEVEAFITEQVAHELRGILDLLIL